MSFSWSISWIIVSHICRCVNHTSQFCSIMLFLVGDYAFRRIGKRFEACCGQLFKNFIILPFHSLQLKLELKRPNLRRNSPFYSTHFIFLNLMLTILHALIFFLKSTLPPLFFFNSTHFIPFSSTKNNVNVNLRKFY